MVGMNRVVGIDDMHVVTRMFGMKDMLGMRPMVWMDGVITMGRCSNLQRKMRHTASLNHFGQQLLFNKNIL